MKVLQIGKTYQALRTITDLITHESFNKGCVFRVIDEKASGYLLEEVKSHKIIVVSAMETNYLR